MDELIRFSSPLDRPLHFLLIELAVLASTVIVFTHAALKFRAGDRRHLFQWIAITSYGVQMELLAFNFLENYEHAQFTVQLYGGQLPLYVTGLYGTFLYAGIKLVERLKLHPIVEALLAGFAICLIDVPFDLAGVAVGWWTWLDVDPNLAFRWLGVPVTSYYWYLIFGAVACLLCRLLWRVLDERPFWIAAMIALPLGSLVIFFGVLGFLPFHLMASLGLTHGQIVAMHLMGCAALALWVRSGTTEPRDPLVLAASLLIPGVLTVLLVGCALMGAIDDGLERTGYAALSLLGLSTLAFALPVRRGASAALAPAAPSSS